MKFFVGLKGFCGKRRKWIFLASLGVLTAAAAAVFFCCRGNSGDAADDEEDYAYVDPEGVPEIRVRLFHNPQRMVEISTNKPWRVLIDGKEVAGGRKAMGATACWYADGRWNMGIMSHGGRALSIEAPGGLVGVNSVMYRGRVVLLAAENKPGFWVQNHLDMESYLFSVVSKELYSDFHPGAFRAQAVAARTFAMYEARHRGKNRKYDVWASQRSQVYGGAGSECRKGRNAVFATRGMVLKYGSPGNERIFLSQFSACNGGNVNGADVIRSLNEDEKIPPLEGGQVDEYGKSCPVYNWKPVRVPKSEIYSALARQYSRIRSLGGIKELQVKTQTDYGRPVWLNVIGVNGASVPVRAEDMQICLRRSDFHQAKNIMSMNCKIRDLGNEVEFYDGRGFGHGVGLSQWGANERARKGIDYKEILEFYYPQADITKEYQRVLIIMQMLQFFVSLVEITSIALKSQISRNKNQAISKSFCMGICIF